METIKLGSQGESVKTLQTLLKSAGYNLQVDGIFGEITDEIVKLFQKKSGLKADGICGTKTWDVLTGSKPAAQTKRRINKIILHCAATREGQNFTIKDIDSWHKKRGFTKIGYHYVIYLDGSVHKGRQESEIGAHATGQNANSIGICYIGGCDKNGKAKDTRTPAQKESLLKLVHDLLKKYNLGLENVYGHYQFSPKKQCPSFSIETFRKEYKEYFSK